MLLLGDLPLALSAVGGLAAVASSHPKGHQGEGLMSVLSGIAGSLAWSVVPRLVASLLLSRFYSLFPTVKRADSHQRVAYTLVVSAYVLYSVLSCWLKLTPNYYAALSLQPRPSLDRATVDRHWRRFGAQLHPDRNGDSSQFALLKRAHAVLGDDHLRLLYDRFGVSAEEGDAKSQSILLTALFSVALHYAIAAGMIFVSRLFSSSADGLASLRYLVIVGACCGHLIAVGAEEAGFLCWVFPRQTLHERLLVFREFFVAVSFAVGHVGPLWFPSPLEESIENTKRAISLTEEILVESARQLRHDLEDACKDERLVQTLRKELSESAAAMALFTHGSGEPETSSEDKQPN